MANSTTPSPEKTNPTDARTGLLLLISIFVLAVCGLVYELIAGTLASYLMGDSITQFSLVIGIFLSAMGVGAYLSRFLNGPLVAWFVGIELLIGLIGGSSALIGFFLFATTAIYVQALYFLIAMVGMFIGMEIPLVIRILTEKDPLRITIANVLAVDYVGALFASLLFPFVLVPHLNLVSAAFCMGFLNVMVAALLLRRMSTDIERFRSPLIIATCFLAGLMVGGMIFSERLVSYFENQIYKNDIIFAQNTKYQRVIITRWRNDIRLFLNGHLQFSTIDEYRYHEPLVQPAMHLAEQHKNILILGGGDGLAAKEILKHRDVEHIDLVDLDPVVTNLFKTHPLFSSDLVNEGSLKEKRVTIHNKDAMQFLMTSQNFYDVIIIDLPDPNEPALAKLYSQGFYQLAERRLAEGGAIVTQATSPLRSRKAFWCIVHTMQQVTTKTGETKLHVSPYHTTVPTFGIWGFVIATRKKHDVTKIKLNVPTKYLSEKTLSNMFNIPKDIGEIKTPVTTLKDAAVHRLYEQGYHKYLD
ncbi:Spermidine synthase [hydrothermal vent metagenome]|uniref:Spermidine synthase n=1 Tax=hydrothermal vent metagenome TaxID=652676 RepID=A0A3B1DHL0_9ZZZZ